MAKEYYDQEIDKHTDWNGDESTGGIPVKGNRVQEFIKNTLNKKEGTEKVITIQSSLRII